MARAIAAAPIQDRGRGRAVTPTAAQAEDQLAEFVERCSCRPAHRSMDAVPPGGGLKRAVAAMDSVLTETSDAAAPFSKSEFFRRPLSREVISNLLRTLAEGRSSGESRELSFTPLRGSYNRVPPQATAFTTVRNCSWLNTGPRSRQMHQTPPLAPLVPGHNAPGNVCMSTLPEGSIRTSPTSISPTGRPLTTAPTTSAFGRSNRPTTHMVSSTVHSPSERRQSHG